MLVFVGGSSRETDEKCFNCAAKAIGEFIAKKGYGFVFGGCNFGLMGVTYREVIKNPDCEIHAVLASEYADDLKEIKYHTAYLLDTVGQRKDTMLKLADKMIFLPGGIGTIDEIMTAIEALRTHQFEGEIIILNLDGYYDSLIHQLGFAKWKGFSEDINSYCRVFTNTHDTIAYLEKRN